MPMVKERHDMMDAEASSCLCSRAAGPDAASHDAGSGEEEGGGGGCSSGERASGGPEGQRGAGPAGRESDEDSRAAGWCLGS